MYRQYRDRAERYDRWTKEIDQHEELIALLADHKGTAVLAADFTSKTLRFATEDTRAISDMYPTGDPDPNCLLTFLLLNHSAEQIFVYEAERSLQYSRQHHRTGDSVLAGPPLPEGQRDRLFRFTGLIVAETLGKRVKVGSVSPTVVELIATHGPGRIEYCLLPTKDHALSSVRYLARKCLERELVHEGHIRFDGVYLPTVIELREFDCENGGAEIRTTRYELTGFRSAATLSAEDVTHLPSSPETLVHETSSSQNTAQP